MVPVLQYNNESYVTNSKYHLVLASIRMFSNFTPSTRTRGTVPFYFGKSKNSQIPHSTHIKEQRNVHC
jgi:hypothetical protein